MPRARRPSIRGKWLLENILGTPPPPPPAERSRARAEDRRRRQADDDARADGGAPRQSRLRQLPQIHGPAGLRAREFRRDRQMARPTDGGKQDRRVRRHARRLPLNGPADLRDYSVSRPDQFVSTVTEKLLTYALGRGVEYYDHPGHSQDRAGRGARRLQMVVSRARDREEHAVPDEEISGAMMIITKKALHRRTVLRGLGHRRWRCRFSTRWCRRSPRAQTRAKPPTRLSIVYLPNGIMMDKWTPDAEGAGFALKPILEPLAPFKRSHAGHLGPRPQRRRPRASGREHRRSCARRRQLPLRRASEEDRRRRHSSRHLDGPDRRQADRQAEPARLARTVRGHAGAAWASAKPAIPAPI